MIVDAVVEGEGALRGRVGKRKGRGGAWDGGNVVVSGESWIGVDVGVGRKVGLREGEERLRVGLVGVDHTGAKVIVGEGESGTNRGLIVLGGPGERNARSEVTFLCGPEIWLSVMRAGRPEGDVRGVWLAIGRAVHTVREKGIERNRGRNFLTVFLIWNAEIDVPETRGDRQLAGRFPLILEVILLLDISEGVGGDNACGLGHERVVLDEELCAGCGCLDDAGVRDNCVV